MSNAGVCRRLIAGTQPGFQHGCRHGGGIGQEHHTGVRAWGAERDGRADGKAAPAGASMAVAGRTIPRGAVVVGTGKIQGERLDIEITSLEYDGTIIPVELAVYDTDGQPGIFIPNSMEMNAVRGGRRQHGRLAGEQHQHLPPMPGRSSPPTWARADTRHEPVYRQKMRTVKVHLKAGYRVMLLPRKILKTIKITTKNPKVMRKVIIMFAPRYGHHNCQRAGECNR